MIEAGIVDVKNSDFKGRIRDREQFDSLAYELEVGANYFTHGFDVKFLELEGKKNIDLQVSGNGIESVIECKRLNYSAFWDVTSANFFKEAKKRNLNVQVGVEASKRPQSYSEARKIAEIMIDTCREETIESKDLDIEKRDLPKFLEDWPIKTVDHIISNPDYAAFSFYKKEGAKKFKEPIIAEFKDKNKLERAKRSLKENLSKATDQLRNTEAKNKVISVDISSLLGMPSNIIGEKSGPPSELKELLKECQKWKEEHREISGIALTWRHLYTSEEGIPAFLVIDTEQIPPFPRGWTYQIGITKQPPSTWPSSQTVLSREGGEKMETNEIPNFEIEESEDFKEMHVVGKKPVEGRVSERLWVPAGCSGWPWWKLDSRSIEISGSRVILIGFLFLCGHTVATLLFKIYWLATMQFELSKR